MQPLPMWWEMLLLEQREVLRVDCLVYLLVLPLVRLCVMMAP
jgi:hypothetical protein